MNYDQIELDAAYDQSAYAPLAAQIQARRTTNSEEVRRRLGYLPENNPLYLDMRVRELLDFAGQAKGLKGQARLDSVNLAMEETGLHGVSGKLVGQLSKGFRQRVGDSGITFCAGIRLVLARNPKERSRRLAEEVDEERVEAAAQVI